MATSTTKTNKPLNPRGNDQSPLAYNRAKLYSGKALDFDGVNDYVEVGSPNFLGLGTNSFSFDFYINSTETNNFKAVIDYRHTSGIGVLVDHRNGGIGGAFQTAEGNFAFDPTTANIPVSGDVFDGKWHHVVFVADRSTSNVLITFYIDGELHYYDSIALEQTSTIEDGQTMFIGSQKGSTLFIDGQIANTRVFNQVLTAAQVADLYNNPEKVVPTGVDNTALKLWLPMMEGAGTTAYDGSGNGNHGTISGATWTHGIGAPVSQTAVIDWNKGTNLLENTESIATSGYWYETVTINGGKLDPAGGTNAVEWVSTNPTNHQLFNPITIAGNCVLSCYVKSDEPCAYLGAHSNGYAVYFDLANETISSIVGSGVSGEIEAFEDWYKITAYFPAVNTEIHIGFLDAVYTGTSVGPWGISTANGTSGFIAFPSLIEGTTKGAYIPNHTTTAITSPVLLPQGLTSGRDITGVNLFENVRKQGALNLDGNSWAEVHDNASLDLTTAVTLEAWVKLNETPVNTDSGILSKYSSSSFLFTYREVSGQTGFACYIYGSGGLVSSYATNSQINVGEYYHAVGVYDGGNSITTYLNGVQVSQNTTSIPSSMTTNALDVEIGKWDTNKITNASIAQPRIYNRALTAEEVQRSYDSGKNIFTNS